MWAPSQLLRRQLYCCHPSSTSKTCVFISLYVQVSCCEMEQQRRTQKQPWCLRRHPPVYPFATCIYVFSAALWSQIRLETPHLGFSFMFEYRHQIVDLSFLFLFLCLDRCYRMHSVFIIHTTGSLFYSALFYLWKSAATRWRSQSREAVLNLFPGKACAGQCLFYNKHFSPRIHFDISQQESAGVNYKINDDRIPFFPFLFKSGLNKHDTLCKHNSLRFVYHWTKLGWLFPVYMLR